MRPLLLAVLLLVSIVPTTVSDVPRTQEGQYVRAVFTDCARAEDAIGNNCVRFHVQAGETTAQFDIQEISPVFERPRLAFLKPAAVTPTTIVDYCEDAPIAIPAGTAAIDVSWTNGALTCDFGPDAGIAGTITARFN